MNKLIYLVIIILLFTSFTALGEPIDSIEQDRKTGELTIRGNINTSGHFSLQILEEGKSISDLYSADDILSVINTVHHIEHDYGEYEVNIMIDGKGNTGEYTVRVNSALLDTPYEKTFYYYDPKEAYFLFISLKDKNKTEILELIEQEYVRDLFEIDVPLFEQIDNKLFVAEYIKEKIQNIDDFETLNYVFTQGCVLSLIESTNEADLVVDAINVYNESLGISELNSYDLYSNFSLPIKKGVCERLMDKEVDSNDNFVDMFNESVILIGIKHATGNIAVRNIMQGNKEVFENYALSKYWNLDNAYFVDAEIAGESFDDLQSLVDKINSIINTGNPSSGNRGGGGGSLIRGSGSTYTINVTQPQQEGQVITFEDLEQAKWAKEGIHYLVQKGILSGKGEGMFYPNDNITREEFIKILVLAFDVHDETAQTDFSDVLQSDWYYSYVASAVKLGLINGINENYFGAGENITRQDMAVLVWRFLNYTNLALPKGEILGFADKVNIGEYARTAISSLREAGIVAGMADGRYLPDDFCTRAQAAVIIYSALKYVGL